MDTLSSDVCRLRQSHYFNYCSRLLGIPRKCESGRLVRLNLPCVLPYKCQYLFSLYMHMLN